MRFLLLILSAALLLGTGFRATAQSNVPQLFSEGQRAYLAGDTKTAKEKLGLVLQLEPKHQAAQNYLRMIRSQEARGGGTEQREKELQTIILPQVRFKDATLDSALEYIKQQAAKINEQSQVNFVTQLTPEQLGKTVTLSLDNVPLTEVLRYIGSVADVTFSIEKYAIIVKPNAGAGTPEPVTRP